MNNNCPICGAEIPEGAKSCPVCGVELNDMFLAPKDKAKQKVKEQEEAEKEAKRLELVKAAQEATAAEQEAEAKRIAQVKKEQEEERQRLEAEKAALREEAELLEKSRKSSESVTPDTSIITTEIPGKTPIPPKAKKNRKTAGVIAAVCTIAVIGVAGAGYMLFLKKPSSVNMAPYIDVEFAGVDGEGYTECQFNLDQLVDNYEKVFTLNDKMRSKIKQVVHSDTDDMSDGQLINSLFDDMFDNGPVSVLVEPDSNLSNDDKVTVTWSAGEETLEDVFGVNFICDPTVFTVEGLEEGSSEEKADKEKETQTASETKEETTSESSSETETTEKIDGDAEDSTFIDPSAGTTQTKTTDSSKKNSNYGKYKLSDTDYLTLRSAATMNDPNNKIMQIPGNAEVTVLQFECNGYWKVNYNGTEGYVLPSYLEPCDGAASPDKIASYKVITDYVTMRDIPSTEGEEKQKITTGAIVDCYDSADNGFLLVKYNGQMGYILKTYNGEVLLEKV